MTQPTNNQPNYQQPGVTVRGKRLTLPWIVGGVVLALVVISCGCCGLVNLAGALNTSGNAAAQATQPVATHAPARPTATPPPLMGKTVLHLSGAADTVTSQAFTVKGDWALTWGCTPSLGNDLMVMVNDPSLTVASSDIPTVRYTCPAHNGAGVQMYHVGGTFTLSVSGGTAWDITVIDVAG